MDNIILIYIFHLAVGVVLSFLISLLPGPVNFLIIQTSLSNNQAASYRISFGSALSELFYCLLAVGAVKLLTYKPEMKEVVFDILHFTSIPLLTFLGWRSFQKKTTISNEKEPQTSRNGFWLGMSLNFLNPMLLPLWLGITAHLRANFEWFGEENIYLLLFASGVWLGTLLLHISVAVVANKFHTTMGEKQRRVINIVTGSLFWIFACREIWIVGKKYFPMFI